MKARLSLVSAIAVTALAVAVPAALADPGLDGAPRLVDAVSYFHANELATAATSGAIPAPYVDAFERPGPTSVQASMPTVEDSGSSIAWGQIAISFVIGHPARGRTHAGSTRKAQPTAGPITPLSRFTRGRPSREDGPAVSIASPSGCRGATAHCELRTHARHVLPCRAKV